jgi:hypothetical protein
MDEKHLNDLLANGPGRGRPLPKRTAEQLERMVRRTSSKGGVQRASAGHLEHMLRLGGRKGGPRSSPADD